MDKEEIQEIKAMLAVIWEKLDKVERTVNKRGTLMAPIKAYYQELRSLAQKVQDKL